MNVNAVMAGTAVATTKPVDGGVIPLTVNSPHAVEALTVSILIEPAAPTWFRKRVRVAFWIWLEVIPGGRELRSN
jgi:hypothetical protein